MGPVSTEIVSVPLSRMGSGYPRITMGVLNINVDNPEPWKMELVRETKAATFVVKAISLRNGNTEFDEDSHPIMDFESTWTVCRLLVSLTEMDQRLEMGL